jgi:hypothetical protein
MTASASPAHLTRRKLFALCCCAGLSFAGGPSLRVAAAQDQTGDRIEWRPNSSKFEEVPTLLVYNTVTGLLAGDLQHAISPRWVQADVDAFPAGWITLGVGTTNQPGRTGELIPDGTARSVHFWWADPSSPSQADVSNLEAVPGMSSVELPFLALGIADPDVSFELALSGVNDVHSFLRQQLAAAGAQVAAVQLEGAFGDVMTTVSYNIPPAGIPTGSVYSGDDFFRFGDYPSGNWRMDGVYTAAQALQPVISTAGNPLHLHGYQPDMELGGHIVSAAAVDVAATVYPLQQVAVRPAGFDDNR